MYRLYKQLVSKVAKSGFGAERREKVRFPKEDKEEQQPEEGYFDTRWKKSIYDLQKQSV